MSATISAASFRHAFRGNGLYIGDGGKELQRIYSSLSWRAIPKCDGRFVCRERRLASLTLAELLEELAIKTSSPIVRCREGRSDADAADTADAVRLKGGGGLLTYEKSDHRFIHTLNTESGLCRKLIALETAGTVTAAMHALQPEAAAVCAALCALLEVVAEDERTHAAPAIAVAFRSHLARSACAERRTTASNDRVCNNGAV